MKEKDAEGRRHSRSLLRRVLGGTLLAAGLSVFGVPMFPQCLGEPQLIAFGGLPCGAPIANQYQAWGVRFNLVVDCTYGPYLPNTPQGDFVARFVDPNNGYADMQATGVSFQLYDVTAVLHVDFWDRRGRPLGTLWVTPQSPNPRIALPGTVGGFDISTECAWHIDYVSFQLAYDYDFDWSYALPEGSQIARLTENDFTQTPPLTYTGQLEGVASGTIHYLEFNTYETSIHTGGYSRTSTLDGSLGQPASTEKTLGGVWEVTPSATFPGSACPSYGGPKKTYYVVGSPLPEPLVTSYLVSLYTDGATPRLMTGIADEESTYQQFHPVFRYGLGFKEWWPKEANQHGSYVGLMQINMDLKQESYPRKCFWDWRANAQHGTDHFRTKLKVAKRLMKSIQSKHPGLRDLTAAELENMGLVLYGPAASGDRSKQYYRVDKSVSPPVWVENTQGNPKGVAYAKRVHRKCQ